MLGRVLLIAALASATGQVFAQEAAPAEPAAPQAATPAPPPADAKPSNETPIASAPAAKEGSLTEGQIDADKIMAMQKAGYQIKNENGQTLLCRRDPQTGSRLRHKTSCMTAREWEQLQEENKMQLKSLERRPRLTKQ